MCNKNIMLLFLSELHQTPDQKLQHTVYFRDTCAYDCIQTNESAIKYMMDFLQEQNEKLDKIFLFSTNRVKEKITVLDDAGNTCITTHEEYFKERIQSECPDVKDIFVTVDYDELQGTEESIRQVVSMAERIKEYQQAYQGNALCVHADMTGGFRHASMMMMSVMQLLKYSGIQIGQVLYSNFQQRKVENVTDVHRMFTLISGADEFVNFGSVKEIKEYFVQREKSLPLERLLTTMEEFSDAIKVCRTNEIEDTVAILSSRIHEFIQMEGKSLQEQLFSQIIDVLKREYGRLLTHESGRFDIIRWCVEKEFLQQALTLCTEWLPEYLVRQRICYTEDAEIQLECTRLGQRDYRTWEQIFIISFYKGTYIQMPTGTLRGRIAAALQEFRCRGTFQHEEIPVTLQQELDSFLTECQENASRLCNIGDAKRDASLAHHAARLHRALQLIWQKNRKNPCYHIAYYDFLRKQDMESVLKQMETFSQKDFVDIFGASAESSVQAESEKTKTASEDNHRWLQRKQQYEKMFASQMMRSRLSLDEAMQFLQGYHAIRTERNQTNHAAGQTRRSVAEIKALILQYLDALAALS